MGFNYRKEKIVFDTEWKKLREQYIKAGMQEEAIQELYDFDWNWFRMRRIYESRVQPLPVEDIDNKNPETRCNLFQRFTSLSLDFEEMEFTGRYAWVETISDDTLSKRLKDLSEDDLELLTLLAIEEYSQSDLARKFRCNQSVFSRKLKRIKKNLK